MIACLAYMFIDLERNEVERGHKAVHNPLKGQAAGKGPRAVRQAGPDPSTDIRHGRFDRRLRPAQPGPLRDDRQRLVSHRGRAKGAELRRLPGLCAREDPRDHGRAGSGQVAPYPGSRDRSPGRMAGLDAPDRVQGVLHAGACSIRSSPPCGRESCWRRPSPISGVPTSRSTSGLGIAAQYGALAIGPLLGSLRLVPSLTKEQRDQLPLILETIGPSIIPALIRHLHDPHEHVRAIVAAALGHLRPWSRSLAGRARRRPQRGRAAERGRSAGLLGEPRVRNPPAAGAGSARVRGRKGRAIAWSPDGRKRAPVIPPRDPIELAVSTLESALTDDSAAVRIQAAGRWAGSDARRGGGSPGLIGMLKEADETVRCAGRPGPRPGRRRRGGDGGRAGRAAE